MQTFLPYPNIVESVKCLDNKRLGKQRVEAMQILKALTNPNYGWQNHPAVKMWKGFEPLLEAYYNFCIIEWISRGFKNTMLICAYHKFDIQFHVNWEKLGRPDWFGNKNFHDSHKSNLLRKLPEHYSQFGWGVPKDLPYVWPIKEEK